MKMADKLQFYGPIPRPIKRALRKVVSVIGLENPVHLIWDDGTNMGRIEACSAFLGRYESSTWNASISVCQFSPVPNMEPFISTANVHYMGIPFNLSQLFEYAKNPVEIKDELKEDIKNTLDDLLVLYRKKALGDETHEKPVSKELWGKPLPIVEKETPLRPTALFVDDRMGQLGKKGYAYLIDAGRKLSSMGFEVWGCQKVPDSTTVSAWNFDPENGFQPASKLDLNDIGNIDIVFLDIVEMPTDPNAKITLPGIHRDLKILSRERSVLPYPQIYMLSHLRRELAAHLCLSQGANYYIEKRELLLDAPRLLPEILHHTTTIRGPESIAALEGVELDAEQTASWTLEKLFPEKVGAKDASDRLNELCKYAYLLYSQNHHIREVTLVRKFDVGLSGSIVLHVRPEDDLGRQRDRVMKIAGKYQMASELRAFSRYIEPYALRGFARVEDNWLVFGEEGAISYEHVGSAKNENDGDGAIIGLHEAFLQTSRAGLDDTLTVLFLRLKVLHTGRHEPQKVWEVWKYFRRELASSRLSEWQVTNGGESCFEILLVRARETKKGGSEALVALCVEQDKGAPALKTWRITEAQTVLGPDFLIRPGKKFRDKTRSPKKPFVSTTTAIDKVIKNKEKYPAGNILKALRSEAQKYIKRLGLDDKLVELAEAAAGNDAYNEPWGIVHGDLHMENVFVNDNEVWVIDYGKTREGPPAIDYAVFEYDVRYRFLFSLLSSKVKHLMECPDKWLQTLIDCIGSFEDSIMTETEVPAWSELSGLDQGQHETFERALQTIRKVRSSAFSQIYKGNERSCWLVLFLYLIRVVQCYHIEAGHEDGPVGTLWAALLAKKIYEKSLR